MRNWKFNPEAVCMTCKKPFTRTHYNQVRHKTCQGTASSNYHKDRREEIKRRFKLWMDGKISRTLIGACNSSEKELLNSLLKKQGYV